MKKIAFPHPFDHFSYSQIDSPIGCLTLIASQQGLHRILWDSDTTTHACQTFLGNINHAPQHSVLTASQRQLDEYFSGTRTTFDIPLDIHGTDFQKQAWQVLTTIPYGKTISYGEQAEQLGGKHKARAVGMANGANPISIIVPCHRVVGANGQLTGFGGGLDKKRFLLSLEQDAR